MSRRPSFSNCETRFFREPLVRLEVPERFVILELTIIGCRCESDSWDQQGLSTMHGPRSGFGNHVLLKRLGVLRISRRLRAAIYGIAYIAFCMCGLPYLFARWLGAGPFSAGPVLIGGGLIVVGFPLFLWCVVLFLRNGDGTHVIRTPKIPPYRTLIFPPLLKFNAEGGDHATAREFA
jgi:hypothetical protein